MIIKSQLGLSVSWVYACECNDIFLYLIIFVCYYLNRRRISRGFSFIKVIRKTSLFCNFFCIRSAPVFSPCEILSGLFSLCPSHCFSHVLGGKSWTAWPQLYPIHQFVFTINSGIAFTLGRNRSDGVVLAGSKSGCGLADEHVSIIHMNFHTSRHNHIAEISSLGILLGKQGSLGAACLNVERSLILLGRKTLCSIF